MPELLFDSLDKVPEGLREAAVDDNGKVKVNVVPRAKLDEFRENNVKVVKERDDLASVLGKAKTILGTEDFDAAEKELVEIRSIAQRVKDGELVENKGLDEAVADRTKEMRSGFETQIQTQAREIAAWKEKATAIDRKLRQTTIDRAISDAVFDGDSGVEPRALTDILRRAHTVFEVSDDGKLAAKENNVPLYGADGLTPMSPKEWLAKLKEEAPYFFKGSNGGGAGGSSNDPKKMGGLTQAQIDKLSPFDKLRLANGEKVAPP